MIAVVQRVIRAKVSVAGETVGEIAAGLAVLLAVQRVDGDRQIEWMAEKLATLRIFPNADGQKAYDRDVAQVGGAILLVSNFTVAAATKKGRRPTLEGAADPQTARGIFDELVGRIRARSIPIQTGRFGADMIVSIENDGPSTFLVASE